MRNSYIVIIEHAFENVVCDMASIWSRPQWVEYKIPGQVSLVYLLRQIYTTVVLEVSVFPLYTRDRKTDANTYVYTKH